MDNFAVYSEAEQKRTRKSILTISITANLLANFSINGVNVAIPSIQKSLNLSAIMVGWVPLSVILAMLIFSTPSARLADIIGRRKVTLYSLLIAVLASLLTSIAWDPYSFLIGRSFIGLGLAGASTSIVSMLTSVFPANQRGRVLGYTISSTYLGLSLGPVICGYIDYKFGWSYIFLFCALTMLPSLLLMYYTDFEQKVTPNEKYDFKSAFFWAICVVVFFTGFSAVDSLIGIILFVLGLILFVIFFKYSKKSKNPILDVSLFSKNRRFAFSSIASFISYTAAMSTVFLVGLFLQYNKGLTPKDAGLVLMIQPVIQACVTPFSGRLADSVDVGKLASVGLGIVFIAISLLAFVLTMETPVWQVVGVMCLYGLGFAIFSAPNSSAIMGAVPNNKLGQASGVLATTRLCGQLTSLSVTTLVLSIIIGSAQITPEISHLFFKAAKICFKIFAVVCFFGIFASLARGKKE